MLRHFVLASASVIALTAAANAADMYRAPEASGGYKDGPAYVAVNWSGFYAGVNGGYAWSQNSHQLADAPYSLGGSSPSGGFGGGQMGYNWQGVWHPNLVLGLEADIQGAGVSDKQFDTAGNRYFTNSSLDWFGTLRGRIGYGFDRALIYGTGGFAYGGVHNHVDYSSNFPGDIFNKSTTATGYVVGGGVEYKINPAWSVKAEYQYINLGKNDPVRATYGSFASAGTKLEDDAFHTVRFGLNYHVLPGYEPLK